MPVTYLVVKGKARGTTLMGSSHHRKSVANWEAKELRKHGKRCRVIKIKIRPIRPKKRR